MLGNGKPVPVCSVLQYAARPLLLLYWEQEGRSKVHCGAVGVCLLEDASSLWPRSSFGLRDLDNTFPEPAVVLSVGLYCTVSTDYQRLSCSSVSCSWLHMGCLSLAMLIETQNLALPIALKHKYTHLQHVFKHTCMTL